MPCNCRGGAPAPGTEYVVVLKDGTETTGYASEIQARVAATKLGGVVKTKPVTRAA